MRRLLLVLVFMIIIYNVSAQNISFSYPEEVYIGEEFTVKVGLANFSGENYDIKFDTSESGGNLLRVLNNGQWRSNHYYVIGVISNNEEKEFTLKVEEYIGTIITAIKIRLSGTNNIEIFGNYEIESLEASKEKPVEEEEEEDTNDEPEEEIENGDEDSIGESASSETGTSELQTIILNPQVIKTDENKKEGSKNYALYGFVAFCVLIGILFIIKNRKDKNEFR